MSISIICISLLGFLAIAMGVAVTVVRGKFNILTGNPSDPKHMLTKLVRAHGNTCEYAAILALMMYILGQSPQPDWVLWFMGLITFCRYLLVAGFIIPRTMAKPNPMRFVGAVGTYFFGSGLCYALLQQSVNV